MLLRLSLFIFVLLLTGCQRPAEKAVLVGNSWLGAAPIYSAYVTHPELLPVELKPVMLVSDVSVLRMLSNDAAAGAFVSLDNALGLNTMTQGDYCVAMVLDHSNGADAILARPDWQEGESETLHVGLEDSTLARYVLSQWMEVNNISAERVTTQALLPTEHMQAWSSDVIDLIVTYQPFVERLKERGAKVVFDSQHQVLNITDVLIIHKQRWADLAPAVQELRGESWQRIMRLLATEQSDFWQALQALSDLGEQELRSGLKSVDFAPAAAQEQALLTLVQDEMPLVAQHLAQSGVYDDVYLLERCDEMQEGD